MLNGKKDAILKKVPGPSQAAATSLLASLDEKSGQIAQLIASKDVTRRWRWRLRGRRAMAARRVPC